VAETDRVGEIRYLGEFDNTANAVSKPVRKLASPCELLHFCYEVWSGGLRLYGSRTRLHSGSAFTHLKSVRRSSGDQQTGYAVSRPPAESRRANRGLGFQFAWKAQTGLCARYWRLLAKSDAIRLWSWR
jgi:hypothetical protein